MGRVKKGLSSKDLRERERGPPSRHLDIGFLASRTAKENFLLS